jgi:hypothetical protein
MLRRKNVVSTSYVPLLFPKAPDPACSTGSTRRLKEGGTSFYTSGIDPGFGNAGITVHALALCKEVRTVRMMEIVNYATWDNPFTMFEIMGFGKSDPSESLLLSPGSPPHWRGDRCSRWSPPRSASSSTASRSGTRSSGPTRTSRSRRAPSAAGTISGMRFEIVGMVGGEARIVVEHVTRLRDEDAPDWPQGEGYRIQITGEPHVHLELSACLATGVTTTTPAASPPPCT